MTPLADLTPLVEVLPATKAGDPRAMKWYRGLLAHGYRTDCAFVFEAKGGPDPYGVVEFPATGGRAFRVTKCGEGKVYAVFCSRSGLADSCDCAAGTYRRGGVVCRHVVAIRAAMDNGWINPPANERPAAWSAGYSESELDQMARDVEPAAPTPAPRPRWMDKAEAPF